MGMETLPPELLYSIVSQVPKHSLPRVRLVNHALESIAFPLLFHHLLHWLDYRRSHAAILVLAQDVCTRPSVMWSPWASEPHGPVQDVWMGLVWRLQTRSRPPASPCRPSATAGEEEDDRWEGGGRRGGEAGSGLLLTPANYASLSGREDMTEGRLRTAQNRYLMHRSYCNGTFAAWEASKGKMGEEDEWKEI